MGGLGGGGGGGKMADQATKQSNWVRMFNVANEFDSWGQIAEAEENYQKLVSQIQGDRAEWATGAISQADNVSRLSAPLRIASAAVRVTRCVRVRRVRHRRP